MILLTVGTQLPFDRFVRIVDDLAPSLDAPVLAQIGETSFVPRNMEYRKFIGPIEFDEALKRCSLIVSHAGVGTVVMAQKHGKPLIVFPRRESMNEHRNDHQMATIRALHGRQGVYVTTTAEELAAALAREDYELPAPDLVNPAREQLRDAVAAFIRQNLPRR